MSESVKITPAMERALCGALEHGGLDCSEVRRDVRNKMMEAGLLEWCSRGGCPWLHLTDAGREATTHGPRK